MTIVDALEFAITELTARQQTEQTVERQQVIARLQRHLLEVRAPRSIVERPMHPAHSPRP